MIDHDESRIKSAKPGKSPLSLIIHWRDGGQDTIDFTGPIHRNERLITTTNRE